MDNVHAVTTYGVPGGNGSRSSEFAAGDLRVLVSSVAGGNEGTEKAFGLACALARSAAAIEQRDAEIAGLKADLARANARAMELQAQLPPNRAAQILDRGYVRFIGKAMWLLGKRERGFAHFGFQLRDWDELFRRYNVRVVENGTDEHGQWWAVENVGETAARVEREGRAA